MFISEDQRHTVPTELQRAAGLSLHEGMYAEAAQRSMDLTSYLESLDPSANDSVLDAFERQLALAGIRVQGNDADIVDRFFASQESSVLFPEFVSRSVQTGYDEFSKLKSIVSERVRIEDNTYRSIYMDESVLSGDEKALATVGEGASLPRIEIQTAEHSVAINKYGRYLQTTYEAIRRKKAPVVSLFLRSIGVQIQRDKFEDAIGVIVNGDGNSNAAPTMNTDVSGTLDYDDLIEFVLSFDPYEMNVLVCNATTAQKLLNVTEVKEPVVSGGFLVNGERIRLFGADVLVDDAVADNRLIGLDRRFALQEIYETGVVVESDRLIRRQIEGTAISEVAGFAKGITAAAKVLHLTWT